MADIIQNPGAVMKSHGTSLLFRGGQGAGKGNFEKLMTALVGVSNSFSTSDINELIKSESNRFADGAVNKVFIVVDEANTQVGYSKADQLKGAITNETISYEMKGIQGIIKVCFFGRYIIFTNHSNSIRIEHTDRRFNVFQTSDKYVGENGVKFGEKMANLYKNKDYIYSVWKYLKSIIIPSDFNFKRDRPLTKAYFNMKAYNIPHVIKFIADRVSEENTTFKSSLKYSSKEMFTNFLEYISDNNFKVHYTSVSFAGSLSELPEDAGITKKKSSNIVYTIDIKKFKSYCKSKKYNLFDECEEVHDDYYPKPLLRKIKLVEDNHYDVIPYKVNWTNIMKGLDVISKLDLHYATNTHTKNKDSNSDSDQDEEVDEKELEELLNIKF
jgi:phage/plasmid-associated DNA primase